MVENRSLTLLRCGLLVELLQVLLAACHRDGLLLVVLEHVVDRIKDFAVLDALVKRLCLNPVLELSLTDFIFPVLVKLLAGLLHIILVLGQLTDEQLDGVEQLALWDCEALGPSLVARLLKDATFPILPAWAHLQSLRVEVLNVPVEPSLRQRCPWVDLIRAIPCPLSLGHQ